MEDFHSILVIIEKKGLNRLISIPMEPEFVEGDIIVVNPNIKPDHNDYVVLKNEEDEAIFKQLKKYGKPRVLHPLNPKYPDIELSDKNQYRIIGKVVEKKRY